MAEFVSSLDLAGTTLHQSCSASVSFTTSPSSTHRSCTAANEKQNNQDRDGHSQQPENRPAYFSSSRIFHDLFLSSEGHVRGYSPSDARVEQSITQSVRRRISGIAAHDANRRGVKENAHRSHVYNSKTAYPFADFFDRRESGLVAVDSKRQGTLALCQMQIRSIDFEPTRAHRKSANKISISRARTASAIVSDKRSLMSRELSDSLTVEDLRTSPAMFEASQVWRDAR